MCVCERECVCGADVCVCERERVCGVDVCVRVRESVCGPTEGLVGIERIYTWCTCVCVIESRGLGDPLVLWGGLG